MSKLKHNNRVLITLKNANNKTLEVRTLNKSLNEIADKLGIKSNLDKGDQITIESEGI